jgi:hypothetical protein
MLAIAGVLFATSSCVDDSESASVTDLRGAKSAQLRALADLAKAQADLAKAQAEAVKISAEAERTAAEAALTLAEAQARYRDARTEIERAEAEEKLRQLIAYNDKLIAGYEADLEKLKLQLELDLFNLQQLLWQAQLDADAQVRQELADLVKEYSDVVIVLNTAKGLLATNSVALAKEELDLASYANDSTRFVNNFIVTTNASIRSYTATIASATKALEEWQAFALKPDAPAKIAAKEAELEAVKASLPGLYYDIEATFEVYDSAAAAAYEIQDIRSDYLSIINNYRIAVNGFAALLYTSTAQASHTDIIDGEIYPYVSSGNDYIVFYWGGNYPKITAYLSGYSVTRAANVYTFYWPYTDEYVWATISSGFDVNGGYSSKEDFENRMSLAKLVQDSVQAVTDIAAYRTRLTALHPQITAAGVAEATALAAKETAEATLNAAWDTLYTHFNLGTANNTDSTRYRNAYIAYFGKDPWIVPTLVISQTGGIYGAWVSANETYLALNSQVADLNAQLNAAKNDLINASINIANYNEILATLSQGPLEKLNDQVDAAWAVYNEKYAIYSDAVTAYNAATSLTGTLASQISSLKYLEGISASGNTYQYQTLTESYVLGQIDSYTQQLNNAEANLANAQAKLANVEVYATDNLGNAVAAVISEKKADIAKLKVQIEEQKVLIEVYEKQLAVLKAAIDALLAE